jgi:hypothetical protein
MCSQRIKKPLKETPRDIYFSAKKFMQIPWGKYGSKFVKFRSKIDKSKIK